MMKWLWISYYYLEMIFKIIILARSAYLTLKIKVWDSKMRNLIGLLKYAKVNNMENKNLN